MNQLETIIGTAWENRANINMSTATSELRQAVDHGFRDLELIAGDPDLKSLHGDPRFQALVAQARQPAPAKAQ